MKSVGSGDVSVSGVRLHAEGPGEAAKATLSEGDYAYYHRLLPPHADGLPRPLVKAIGRSTDRRRFPSLIDPVLPKQLAAFFLVDDKASSQVR